MKPIVLTTVLAVAFWAAKAEGQCPWSRDPQVVELQSSCICNSSGKEGFNALSVQCQAVNFPMLMSALRTYTSDIILENLYISNTTIGNIKYFILRENGPKMSHIHFHVKWPHLTSYNLNWPHITSNSLS